MDFKPLEYENIEALAARAFSISRLCAMALHADVLPNFGPQDRRGAKRLLAAIENRKIFDDEPLIELDVLIDKLSREIAKGTKVVEVTDNDPCNFSSNASWNELQRTKEADDMSRALTALLELQEALHAVHDLMHAERALEQLRQRL